MNRDTIALDTGYNDGHRVKRIKIEQVRAGNKGVSRASGLARLSQNGNTNGGMTEVLETMEVDTLGGNMGTTLSHAAHTIRAEPGSTSIHTTRDATILSSHDSPRPGKPDNKDLLMPTTFDSDLLTAPSDPKELAWWVAQQVTHFYRDSSESPVTDLDDQSRRVLSHPPGVRTRHSDAELEPEQFVKKQKQREEARERKKQWRESNALKNKDNDLRCRLNKLAKDKFGAAASAEKSAFIEAEFNKRRNKRELRQRARAVAAGEIPSFGMAPELRDRIFSSPNLSISKEVETIGNLLLAALFGGGNYNDERQTAEAAKALEAALKESSLSPQLFIEALKLMAKNSELMQGINAKMQYDGQDDEPMSGDDSGSHALQTGLTRSTSTSSQGSALNHESQEKIRALNAATALLNQLSDTKVYASPYGQPPLPAAAAPADSYKSPYSNPPPAPAKATTTPKNSHGPDKPDGTGPPLSSKQNAIDHGLDKSQIDALLALANGGSLTDDEDDKTIADPDEVNGQQLESPESPQTDSDITATLQQVLSQLVTERREGQSKVGMVEDPRDEQAATLRSLFTQAGVEINTIIPAALSLATSQLYSHLSSQARSTTPSGGTNLAQTAIYGNTVNMPQISQAKPGVFGLNHAQHYAISPSVGYNPNEHIVGLPVRHRNPEELKKIKTYGFPPLPGSRPGAKRT